MAAMPRRLSSVDGKGGKHPLGVIEEAAENGAVAQALLDNLTWACLPNCAALWPAPTSSRT
jgi:hypothetical protein